MQCDLLSNGEYTQLLQALYKTAEEVEFVCAELRPISENVEGLLGVHSNLHVTFKRGDVTTTEIFFLKRKPQNNKLQTDLSNELRAYDKEIFVFDYLIKQFERYGCETDFAARCVHVVRGEALIFENLTLKGYKLNDRHKKFNMVQTECALSALAKFHGAGIIHDLKKSTELHRKYTMAEEFPDIFQETIFVMDTNPTGILMKMWDATLKTFRVIIDLLPDDELFKQKFVSMVFKFKFGACFTENTKYLKTCGHGDLWSNNMLFKYGSGGELAECRLVDFQVCRYFYPALDFILLIFANTTPAFRTENLQKLYEYYYECLGGVLAKQGYQLDGLMSFKDFLETVKLLLRDAMLQILNAVLAVNLPKDLINSFVEGDSSDKFNEFMFENWKMCSDAFKNDATYKQIITEAFQEYFNILLSYE